MSARTCTTGALATTPQITPGGASKSPTLDERVLSLFDTLRVDDEEVRAWFVEALQARTRKTQERSSKHLGRLGSRVARVRSMRDELLNGRLAREFDEETFAHKDTELRDEEARLKDQIDAIDDHRTDETSLVVETLNSPNTCATNG